MGKVRQSKCSHSSNEREGPSPRPQSSETSEGTASLADMAVIFLSVATLQDRAFQQSSVLEDGSFFFFFECGFQQTAVLPMCDFSQEVPRPARFEVGVGTLL